MHYSLFLFCYKIQNRATLFVENEVKYSYFYLFLRVLAEPGTELLGPDAGEHLGPDHIDALVVHLLSLVIGPGSLSVVILGENLHFGRVGCLLLSRIKLVHVNLSLLRRASIKNLIQFLTKSPKK